jgi:hypothetical protein
MELQEFPIGKKFYAVNQNTSVPDGWLNKVLSKKYLEYAKYITDEPVCYNKHLSTYDLRYLVANIEILSDEEYPKIKVNSNVFFLSINENWSVTCKHVAALYQTPERLVHLSNMPYFKGMIIQWDPVRKGFILHNSTYEGPLVPSKTSAKVKQDIKAHIDHLLGDVNMFTVLGEDLVVPNNMVYMSSVEEARELHKVYLDTLNSTPTERQTIQMAISCKAYTSKFACRPHPNAGKFILQKSNKKPKLHTSARTKLIYQLGGLSLPLDYNEWFDGDNISESPKGTFAIGYGPANPSK